MTAISSIKRKPFLLIVGKSGSGKDFLIRLCGLKPVISRTTRPRRPGEQHGKDKLFVTDAHMNAYGPKARLAYLEYAGSRYCVLRQDLAGKDAFVVDPDGVRFFRQWAQNGQYRRPIVVVYVKSPWYRRFWRIMRRENMKTALRRIWNDFWQFYNFSEYDVVLRN